MSDVETWRVECDGGDVREAFVTPVASGRGDVFEVAWECFAVRGVTRRIAVTRFAAERSWPVAGILAPGQLTRAEVERDLAATRADLEAALLTTEARSVDLLIERTHGAEWMRATCADLCDARAVEEGSNALQYAARAIRALPLPAVIETKDEEARAEVEAQLRGAKATIAELLRESAEDKAARDERWSKYLGDVDRLMAERDADRAEIARLRALLSPAAIVSRPACATCLRAWDVCVCEVAK